MVVMPVAQVAFSETSMQLCTHCQPKWISPQTAMLEGEYLTGQMQLLKEVTELCVRVTRRLIPGLKTTEIEPDSDMETVSVKAQNKAGPDPRRIHQNSIYIPGAVENVGDNKKNP